MHGSKFPFAPDRTLALRSCLCLAGLSLVLVGCGTVPLQLPDAGSVVAGEPTPIDGRWRMEPMDAGLRIEGGRIWAEHAYVEGVFRVDPQDVIVRDIEQVEGQRFVGLNVFTSVRWQAEIQEDGTLVTRTDSLVGPVTRTLHPVALDDAEWFVLQRTEAKPVSRPSGYAAHPTAPAGASSPPSAGTRPLSGGAATSALPQSLSAASVRSFGRYHALVIGNDGYRSFEPLLTAGNDARSVAALLESRYGFEVQLLLDATRAEILVALADLRRRLTVEDNLLIYYAGHGWLDEAADEGYWLPVDATPANNVNWIANSAITAYFKAITAKHVLVVADSCYSGKLTRGIRMNDRAPDDLSRLSERRARVVLTSGGLEPVADSGGGDHSAFAAAFLGALESNQQVLDTTTLYGQIRRPVMLAADQAPELADIRKAGHDGGDFLFVPVK
jgi:hypothetical protein